VRKVTDAVFSCIMTVMLSAGAIAEDDLENFFYIFVWVTANPPRYLKSTLPGDFISNVLEISAVRVTKLSGAKSRDILV
jgi:hypothetical protein